MGNGGAVGWFRAAGMPMLSCTAPVGAWGLAYICCGRSSQSRQPLCPAVYARDAGLPPSLTKATVWVTVGDENDHAPHLERESCSVEVPENQSRVALYTLRATDPDGGENGRLEYRLTGEMPWECGTRQGLLPGLPCIQGHQQQQSCSMSVLSCSKLHGFTAISQPPVKGTLRSRQAALLTPHTCSPGFNQFHTSPCCSDLLIHRFPGQIFAVSCHRLSGYSLWQQQWPKEICSHWDSLYLPCQTPWWWASCSPGPFSFQVQTCCIVTPPLLF